MASGSKFFPLVALAIVFLGAMESRGSRVPLSFGNGNQGSGFPAWGGDASGYFPFFDGSGKWTGGWPGSYYRPGDGYRVGRPGASGGRGGNQHDDGNRFGWMPFRFGPGNQPGSGGQYWWNTGRNYQGGPSSWADSSSTGNGFGSGFGYGSGGGKRSSSYSSSGGGQSGGFKTDGHEVEGKVATTNAGDRGSSIP